MSVPCLLTAFLRLFPLFVGLHRLFYLLGAKDPLDLLIVGKEKPQAPAAQGLAVLNASYFTPTRSCQKFSKQICLWDLVQGIGIIFIIQIVMAI